MKTLAITLILFFSASAQNIWYVDYETPAGENGDGTSWATAWKYLGNSSGGGTYGGVNWGSLSGGDTVYMSGGSVSKQYLARFSGQAHYIGSESGSRIVYTGNPVVITKSWEVGHNGEVILSILDAIDATRGILQINRIENIKVTGLTLKDIRTPEGSPSSVMVSVYGGDSPNDSWNIFEGNKLYMAGITSGIGWDGYNILIKDNYLEDIPNEYVFGQDPFGGTGGMGTIIDGNTVILKNNYTAVPNQTANVSVTTTATSLTDTRVNEETNYHVGITIQVNGNWNMIVTGNSGSTFTGSAGWEYATFSVAPDNGNTYTNTSLNDASANYAINQFVGTTVTAGGKSMVVTSNSAKTIYGNGWSGGGHPANVSGYSFSAAAGSYPPQGAAWRMEGAHRDGMQFSSFYPNTPISETLTTIMRNNIIIDEGTRGTGWNGLIYTSSIYANQRWLVYNNIFASKQEISSAGIFMYESEDNYPIQNYFASMKFLNNTIIMKGSGSTHPDGRYSAGQFFNFEDFDSLEIKNNLFICDTTMSFMGKITTGLQDESIDYNIYAYDNYNRENFAFATGGGDYVTLSEWRSMGFDIHSDTLQSSTIFFANKYGTLGEDYRTTAGLGLAENLSVRYPFLRYDINGNDRGSSWDIGAIQYNGIPPVGNNDINVKSKIFLQGPFNTNSMNTNLSQNSLLPNNQPFNTAPWNYNGSESLSLGSNSSFVDWVLVELRSSSNPTQVVSRKAAILKNDGTLLNSDGSTGVPFSNVQEGAYYVAVFHRNHLAVMSANPVQLSANSQIYDFTNGMDKAYGTNPMANLGNGMFGMFAGDGNSNGGITIADRNEVWLPQNGTLGYLKGDFNLDGGVTIHDINLYWNINNGTMTQVP